MPYLVEAVSAQTVDKIPCRYSLPNWELGEELIQKNPEQVPLSNGS